MFNYYISMLFIILLLGCNTQEIDTKTNPDAKRYSDLRVKTVTVSQGYNDATIYQVDKHGLFLSGKGINKSNYIYKEGKLVKFSSKEDNDDYERLYFYNNNSKLSKVIVVKNMKTIIKHIIEYDDHDNFKSEAVYEVFDEDTLEISYKYYQKNTYSNDKLSKVVMYRASNSDTGSIKLSETFYNFYEKPTKLVAFEEDGKIDCQKEYIYNSENLIESKKEFNARYDQKGLEKYASKTIIYTYYKNLLLKSVKSDRWYARGRHLSGEKTNYEYTYDYTRNEHKNNFFSFLFFWESERLLSLENPSAIIETIWSVEDEYGNINEYYKFYDSVFVKLEVHEQHVKSKDIIEWELIDMVSLESFPKVPTSEGINTATIVLKSPSGSRNIIIKHWQLLFLWICIFYKFFHIAQSN